jgi:Flp pilus assembly protein TadG
MSRRLFHIARGERGSAATEFALLLPLMAMLLFSFFEMGRIYWNYHIVKASARDAARYAARMPVTCGVGSTGTFDDANDEAEIQNLTRTGTLDASSDPLVPGWTNNATVTVLINCIDNTAAFSGRYAGYAKIPTVTITAAAPYGAMFGGLMGGFTLPTITVSNAQPWTE